MISRRWFSKRTAHWQRLEHLLDAAERRLRTLTGPELQELAFLYRQTASDLATVNEDRTSASTAAYLNHLLGRCHNFLYAAQQPERKRILRFFVTEYPQLFRECLPVFLLVAGLFLAGALAGWATTAYDPAFAHRLLGPQMMDTIDQRKMWTEPVIAVKPLASSFIATNNLSVAFSAFALGITGIGTIWLMIFNGLMVGVIGMATTKAGMAVSLWSFVAPHGVLEIPAILIAGAAGLELARGLIFPGLLPRRESLVLAGSRAVRLLVGAIPMLLIAGIIEGFFSPTHVSPALKFALAGVLFTALIFYLTSRVTIGATKDAQSGSK